MGASSIEVMPEGMRYGSANELVREDGDEIPDAAEEEGGG
jgi:hypothetical protein